MSRGWRLGTVIGEAVANLVSSRPRLVVLGASLSGLLGALVWVELSFTADVKEQARRFEAAGANVAVVDGPDGLDAARCEALRSQDHVVAAGGFRDAGQVSAAHSPGVFFSLWEVTGDVVRVWDPDARSPTSGGFLVGAAAAGELGLANGSWLSLNDEPPAPVTIIDPEPRNQFATRGIFALVPPKGDLAQCWAAFSPEIFAAALDWLPAHFEADDAEARRVVSRGEFGLDPLTLLRNRPQRWGWLPVSLVGATTIVLLGFFRRSETAVYRAFGLSRSGMLLMFQTETIGLVLGAFLVGALWAAASYSLAAGLPSLDQVWLALRTAGMAAALICILGPLGAMIVCRGSTAKLLKET